MMNFRCHLVLKALKYGARMIAVGVMAGTLFFATHHAYAAKNIPWNPDKLFEWTANQESIKSVLRRIMALNGQRIAFSPGVDGAVSFTMSNLPVQAAFNKLISEQGLDYDYDPGTNMVTVFSEKPSERARAFVPLAQASKQSVLNAVKKFGLGGQVSFDNQTKTVLLEGTPDEVSALKSVVERMDQAAVTRSNSANKRAAVIAAEEDIKANSDLLEKLLNQDVRVIRLRFANVASTTKEFQGESVTVPGIEESIRALLGDSDKLREALPEEFKKELDEIAPQSLTGIFLSTDPRTNSVIVRGTPEEVDNVEQLVRQLDKPVPLVQIEILVVNATRGISETIGANWAYAFNVETSAQGGDNVNRTRAIGVNSGIANANPLSVSKSNTDLGGLAGAAAGAATVINTTTQSVVAGLVLSGLDHALQVQLAAFEQDNKTQTIASPTLVTTNNVAAKIERTASEFLQVSTNNASDIEEVDVGLKLTVTPSVISATKAGEEDLIRLVVNARNTAIGSSSISTASTSGQEVQSEVIVPNGRTFMLGGLADDSRTENEKGIPLLKDLPFIGKLFGTETSTDSFEETIFFITPTVIYPQDILPRDIASRRYVKARKFDLAENRKELQQSSNVLTEKLAYQEEDE